MPAGEAISVRLSTGDLPAHDCAEILRETYGRTVLRAEIAPLGDGPARLDMDLFAVPGLGVATGACSPFSVHRTSALIDNDDIVLLVALSGATAMRHRGREETIESGAALLLMNDDVGYNRMLSDFRCLNISMPRAALAPLIGDLPSALMQPIHPQTGALRLLMHYAGALQAAASSPELRQAVVSHVYDLVALAAGATRDAAATARNRGVRAARLRAIKADISGNLQSDISPSALAARHNVSERYIRKLFESEGMSLSDFVLEQKLLRAHRMLADWRLLDRTIAAIAFEAGFNDLSYFNRAFRRRYGHTPSDIRKRANPD
ncbi:MAG TPA: AraC family transcriptional regulator [Hyphomonadaceae bacterium]|jgi:AraC-like DNA-binding protein|nr:AraC family transcriptional regulator [Hyphomonadaceae bacterium]